MSIASANFLDTVKKGILKKWIDENGITREQVMQFAPVFPDKSMRNLVESGVIYYVA